MFCVSVSVCVHVCARVLQVLIFYKLVWVIFNGLHEVKWTTKRRNIGH